MGAGTGAGASDPEANSEPAGRNSEREIWSQFKGVHIALPLYPVRLATGRNNFRVSDPAVNNSSVSPLSGKEILGTLVKVTTPDDRPVTVTSTFPVGGVGTVPLVTSITKLPPSVSPSEGSVPVTSNLVRMSFAFAAPIPKARAHAPAASAKFRFDFLVIPLA